MSDEIGRQIHSMEEGSQGRFLFPSVLATESFTGPEKPSSVPEPVPANTLSGFSSFVIEPNTHDRHSNKNIEVKSSESNIFSDTNDYDGKQYAELQGRKEIRHYENQQSSESDEYQRKNERKKKKKKEKKKLKRRKLKEKQKLKVLFDKSKPDTIWLDGTDLKIKDAFREDRREDRDNIQFDTLYRLDVASYKRKRDIVCLGMKQSQQFKWNDEKGKKRKPKSTSTDDRYFNSVSSHNKQDCDDPNLDIKELLKSLDECEYLNEFKNNVTVDKNDDKSRTDHFSQKTEFYNQHLRENPNDVSKWIEFARLQDESFSNLDNSLISSTFDSEKYPVGKHRAITEKKITILEKALAINKDSLPLILEYMEFCREILDPTEVQKKWHQFTFHNPNRGLLWQSYLLYVQSDLSNFFVSNVTASYGKCFKTMSAIAEGTVKTHKPDSNHLEYMLGIFVQYCLFLHQSDLPEKATASLQAMIEFNCFVPNDIGLLPGSSQQAFFEAFWDSDAPRFGEPNASGWATWMLFQNGSTVNIESCPKYENISPPLTFGDDSDIFEEVVDRAAPKSKNWLSLERQRQRKDWMPTKQSADERGIEDPDRIVLADDILPSLFKLRSENDIQYLLLIYLSFLGVPIRKQLLSGLLCEVLTQAGLLPVRMTLFASGITEDFFCLNRTDSFGIGESSTELNDARINYIENVYAQSLRLASNYSDHFTNTISLCWLLFKITLLKKKLLATDSHKLKADIKLVRKFAKSLMKLQPNRNCLELWVVFAYYEYDFGQCEESFRIFDMVISMCVDDKMMDILNKSVAVFRNYVSFLMNLCCKDVSHKDDLENKIINVLCLLSGETSPPANAATSTVKVNPLRLRRMKESYKERFTTVMDDSMRRVKETSSNKSTAPNVDQNSFEWILCFALFMFFAESALSAESVLLEIEQNTRLTHKQALEVSKVRLDIQKCRNIKLGVKTPELRNELWSAVSRFAEEPSFHEALLMLENTGLASLKIRRYYHLNLEKCKSLFLWVFAIHYEEERLKKLETLIRVDNVDFPAKTQNTVFTTIPNTGIINRLRGLYNRATSSREGRYCVALWREFLTFEAKYGDARRTKNTFYAALQNCPWAKDLYIDAIELLGDSFDDIIDIMHEKEIRIRLPTEELDILLE